VWAYLLNFTQTYTQNMEQVSVLCHNQVAAAIHQLPSEILLQIFKMAVLDEGEFKFDHAKEYTSVGKYREGRGEICADEETLEYRCVNCHLLCS